MKRGYTLDSDSKEVRVIISEKYNLQYISFVAWVAFIVSFFMPFVTVELFLLVRSFSAIESMWSWIHIILMTLLMPYARGSYPFKRLAVLDDIWAARGLIKFLDKFMYSIAGYWSLCYVRFLHGMKKKKD